MVLALAVALFFSGPASAQGIKKLFFWKKQSAFSNTHSGNKKEHRKALHNIKKGDVQVEHALDYDQALSYYRMAYRVITRQPALNYKIGMCLLLKKQPDPKEALKYLEHAHELDSGHLNKGFYYLPYAYHLQSDWNQAIELYTQHRDRITAALPGFRPYDREIWAGELKKVNKRLEEALSGKELSKTAQRVAFKNLGRGLNSQFPEFAPVINSTESVMFFTSRRAGATGYDKDLYDGFHFEDIYVSRKTETGEWGRIQQLTKNKVNSAGHESVVGVSPIGNQVIVYKGINGGDLYLATLEGLNLRNFERLPSGINSPYSETSAAFTSDAETLYFTSDRPGGKGGKDIYRVQRNGEKWGQAENIAEINSPYDEDGVFVSADDSTLYFSSKGHDTIGGFDLFMSRKGPDGKWGSPENMGIPLNTPWDDVFAAVSMDGKRFYYATTRKGGWGEEDLYMATVLGVPKLNKLVSDDYLMAREASNIPGSGLLNTETLPVTNALKIYRGVATDPETGLPVAGEVTITDNATGKVLYRLKTDPKTGKFAITVPADRDLGISVKAEGYVFHSDNLNAALDSLGEEKALPLGIENKVQMQKIGEGSAITLKNIFFDLNKAELRAASMIELENVLELMNANPGMTVEVSGHTDNTGNRAYNERLSTGRAKAVASYLIAKGIDSKRVTAVGYAFDKPVASNDTEEGRQKNRRTEFKILKLEK